MPDEFAEERESAPLPGTLVDRPRFARQRARYVAMGRHSSDPRGISIMIETATHLATYEFTERDARNLVVLARHIFDEMQSGAPGGGPSPARLTQTRKPRATSRGVRSLGSASAHHLTNP